jgi:glycosyltransferase involved in cell wall biosynthesis
MEKDTSINNKKKRIGIDAKWYLSGPSSGRVVVKNLVDSVVGLNTKNVVVLFVFESDVELISKEFLDKVILGTVEIIAITGKFNFLLNVFKVQNLAIKNNVEVVLFQNFISLFPSSKVKNVAYVHDLLFLDYPKFFSFGENILYRIMSFLLRNADHIITISESEKVRILNHTKINESKISVIRHGVSEKFNRISFESGNDVSIKYELPKDYILYIGRINVRKNISVLIQAMKHINIPLVLIGKKEHKSIDIDQLSKNFGVTNKIIQLGYVPESDLISILSSSRVFCFPSYIEGFGLPPLEAMKSGVPVVTTRGTSIPEVCGEAVLYFEPNDYIELAQMINSIINDDRIRTKLIDNGLLQASKFTWDNSAKALLKLMESI